MRYKTEGNKKVTILEDGNEWIVKTHVVKNDIIRDLDWIKFYKEQDCINYVCNFFLDKNVKIDWQITIKD